MAPCKRRRRQRASAVADALRWPSCIIGRFNADNAQEVLFYCLVVVLGSEPFWSYVGVAKCNHAMNAFGNLQLTGVYQRPHVSTKQISQTCKSGGKFFFFININTNFNKKTNNNRLYELIYFWPNSSEHVHRPPARCLCFHVCFTTAAQNRSIIITVLYLGGPFRTVF